LPSRALEEAEASAGPLAGVVEQALARRQAVELAQEPVSLEAAEWAGPSVAEPELGAPESAPGGLLTAERAWEPVSLVVAEWAGPPVAEPEPAEAESVPVSLVPEERRDTVWPREARWESGSVPGGLRSAEPLWAPGGSLLAEPSREPPVSPGAPGRGSMDPQAS